MKSNLNVYCLFESILVIKLMKGRRENGHFLGRRENDHLLPFSFCKNAGSLMGFSEKSSRFSEPLKIQKSFMEIFVIISICFHGKCKW